MFPDDMNEINNDAAKVFGRLPPQMDGAAEMNADHVHALLMFAIRLLSLNLSPEGYAVAFGIVANLLPTFAMDVLDVVEEMSKTMPELRES